MQLKAILLIIFLGIPVYSAACTGPLWLPDLKDIQNPPPKTLAFIGEIINLQQPATYSDSTVIEFHPTKVYQGTIPATVIITYGHCTFLPLLRLGDSMPVLALENNGHLYPYQPWMELD